MHLTYPTHKLLIKLTDTESGAVEKRASRPVSELIPADGNSEDSPIYFSQPAPPCKFIISLSYILCLYFDCLIYIHVVLKLFE